MSRTGCPVVCGPERGGGPGSGDAGTMEPDVGVARTDDAHPGYGGGAVGGSAATGVPSLDRGGSAAACVLDESAARVARTHSVNCLNICLFTLSIMPRPNC